MVFSGGSRILKRGVPVCDLSVCRVAASEVWEHAGKFWTSGLLRSFLVYSWGEISKAGRPTAKPVVVFEARTIKTVTPLQVGHRGRKAAGYPRKAQENKRSHTDYISLSLAAE